MNIQLHIERLILDGIDIPWNQQPALQTALTEELTRLVAEGGLRDDFHVGGAIRSVSVTAVHQPESGDPAQFGRAIAHSVYGGIGQ